VSAGALILGIRVSTIVLSAVPASSVAALAGAAAASSPSGLHLDVRSHEVAYGHDVVVTGTAPRSEAGQRLELEFAPAGGSSWRTITSAAVRRNGHFRLAAPLWRSGLVKVVGPSSSAGAAVPLFASAVTSTSASSGPERVTVAAALRVPSRPIGVLGGGTVILRGSLLPAVGGRRVTLEGRANGGWYLIAGARSGPRGGFHFSFRPGGFGIEQLRVGFGGDRLNGRSSSATGPVIVYRQAVASWYSDGGMTACGFHAVYGVASRWLPCGATVSFEYGGRTVTAVVDDRGPYVGGRDWDLNKNTAAALGFGGIGVVWSSS
jgi:hypothetical protein